MKRTITHNVHKPGVYFSWGTPDYQNMTSPNPEDIYSLMGFTLSYLQSVEGNIKFVTTFVLQDGEPLNLEKLESINYKERKKALGYFIGKVKERVELLPKFEELMLDFLSNRNDFIHNQDKIPNWNLGSPEGLAVARKYTTTLLLQAHKINEIFAALIIQWGEQAGMHLPQAEETKEYIRDVEDRYGALVNILFSEKQI